jgi:VRR-NUC domain
MPRQPGAPRPARNRGSDLGSPAYTAERARIRRTPASRPRRTAPIPDLMLTPQELLEEQEQADLVKRCAEHEKQWPELKVLFHIPNGGWRGSLAGLRMTRAGVKKGVPDMCLPVMRVRPDGLGCFGGLWVEMKKKGRSTVSKEQKLWIRRLRRCGYAVAVCKGMEIAWTLILWYLSLEPVVDPVTGVELRSEIVPK